MSSENPRKWRFAWEAQSHTPTLKLTLFDSQTNPSLECTNLHVNLKLSQSHLHLTWINQFKHSVSLRVPLPKVFIDPDSQLSFRAFQDHIEVKLVLLLPVDHPIYSNSSFVGDGDSNEGLVFSKPLNLDSDLKSLSSMGEGEFYCRSCSTKLTKSPIRHFVEMPSVNWRETADNWFGACCCSFGGISEKLVSRYADAYTCSKGTCFLCSSSLTLCKDDLEGCKFADSDGTLSDKPGNEFSHHNVITKEKTLYFGPNPKGNASCDSDGGSERVHDLVLESTVHFSHLNFGELSGDLNSEVTEEELDANKLVCVAGASDVSEAVVTQPGCCNSMHHAQDNFGVSTSEVHQPSSIGQENTKPVEVIANQRCLLNGFLGDVFMARSYNLSTDVKWKQFFCPHCSALLGAYPCAHGDVPLDNGVRLFKCELSTSLPVGGPNDLFRKYNLEKMFTNQLIESAKDELSFRTVVRDLTTKSPMLQVVLINPTSWCCTGSCLDSECITESGSKLDLQPVIKLLFADCSNDTESQQRVVRDWISNNRADEFFMLPQLIQKLARTVISKKDLLPPSCTSFQNLSSSFLLR